LSCIRSNFELSVEQVCSTNLFFETFEKGRIDAK
jgi:hypothetical protein